MSSALPVWPPSPYDSNDWTDHWLRFETEYPGSGRPSRLVSHSDVPYVENVTARQPGREELGTIASNYLRKLEAYLREHGKSLDLPTGWDGDLVKGEDGQRQAADLMHWLDVWPPVGDCEVDRVPGIASWNLSRDPRNALPATIIMVATEVLDADSALAGYSFGLRVPMLVEPTAAGSRVLIRSMTAEYPPRSRKSWSSVSATAVFPEDKSRKDVLGALIGGLTDGCPDIVERIGASASVVPGSIHIEEVRFVPNTGVNLVEEPLILETVSKARGAIERVPGPLSYRVVNRIAARYDPQTNSFDLKLLGTETCPLTTDVGAGEARVFTQTPPASILPGDPAHPDAPYDWRLHRPTREDEILDRFREIFSFGGIDKSLRSTGFNVRLCPEFVPADEHQPQNATRTKTVRLPANNEIPPRRDAFSALSAYVHCSDFFSRLAPFGIDPATFVVRAETDIQIFYRHGMTSGPGKDGNTVNAQVAFDCEEAASSTPPIRMNLALAELSRWDRPLHSDGERTWAEPLGIAADKRWILHEFGHYLLAARIGKLEFDFAHSAGDGIAAIACDPGSRLADTRNGVAGTFRGITYPFVFSTRRHDRSPTLGWAWYGELNRSVIEAPPRACDIKKGYLTEQILSSTLFRLYRSLGGDTMAGEAPDPYLRQRASFLTLYLLIQAINGFGQSPSRAEMLELGMEEAGRDMAGVLEMAPQKSFAVAPPQPDQWKGGLIHKVVRWAFETQGMFVQDPEKTHNGMGPARDVDVYVQDRRPLSEVVNGSRFAYGPGSYCPVSLDWNHAALWQMPGEIVFGNRGSAAANACHLRGWIGVVNDPDLECGLVSQISWLAKFLDIDISPIAAGEARSFQSDEMDAEVESARSQADSGAVLLVLLELTCPDDRANTDPLQEFAVRVGADLAVLPLTPRALTDLVANDNNLGLQAIPVP